ncbi:MAG: metalloregulator ArsR/SmtB family transcription factor [Proteobacteria bacterium]|nr:metalloregulator ArsR/SmtB family transcription factor [Pseudomonadota bacterium]
MNSLNYFKALSDSTRIRIYNVLQKHELSVNELVTLMDMGQSRISRHLKILTDSGLLKCRRNGVWAFYTSHKGSDIAVFSEAVQSLFSKEAPLRDDCRRAELMIEERSAKTRHFFNSIAHKWDVLKKDILGSFDINAAILDSIGETDHAVDLGCGTGELLTYLTRHAGQVIGVDSSAMMLAEARKRFSQGNIPVDLRLGELEHLPLKDREVDLAIISLALHHLSEPEIAIKEAHRILKDQGILIIAEFERHDNEMLRQEYGDRWLGFSSGEMKQWITDRLFSLCQVKSHNLNQSLVLNIYTCNK